MISLTSDCTDLVQDCMNIREELFRHLSLIENLQLSMVQNLLSIAVDALIVIVTLFSIVLASRDLIKALTLPSMEYLPIYLAIIFYVGLILWLYNSTVKPTKQTLDIIKNLKREHIDALKEYLNKLRSCCKMLREQGYAGKMEIVCADLGRLEAIVRQLESKSKCITTSIPQCLLT